MSSPPWRSPAVTHSAGLKQCIISACREVHARRCAYCKVDLPAERRDGHGQDNAARVMMAESSGMIASLAGSKNARCTSSKQHCVLLEQRLKANEVGAGGLHGWHRFVQRVEV